MSSYWSQLQRELYDRVYTSEKPSHFAHQHGRIIAALRERDATTTRTLMAEHIRTGWEAIEASFAAGRGNRTKSGSL